MYKSNQLVSVLDKDTFNKCQVCINRVREAGDVSIMEHQKAKYNLFWNKTTGCCPNGGNFERYMYTMDSGYSTQQPPVPFRILTFPHKQQYPSIQSHQLSITEKLSD